ncbi:MAG TPA: Hsp20/alpha crystallin family protein [Firmicutes bacterium]|nr:Hsp20/alpha crystallin family protein [Bacillota bacterium]
MDEGRYPAEWRRGGGAFGLGPWAAWREWLEDMPLPWEGRPGWLGLGRSWPSVDVYQTDDEVVVRADLPGWSPENVDVHVTEDSVTLRGEMQRDEEEQQGNAYRLERRRGSFLRTIALPGKVDPDRAVAQFRQGILEIRLPRSPAARGRKLRINPVQ